MRRELIWALAGSALLSAWALLNPGSKTGGVVAPVERAPGAGQGGGLSTESHPPPDSASLAPLPVAWPSPQMDAANRSPFTAPAPPTPKPVVSTAVVPPLPAPPPPPQVTYRFWGSLTTPAGEHVFYVARDDNAQPVPVRVGTVLDGGYAVEQITSASIVLVQAESQRHVTLPLAPPPSVGAH